VFLYVFCRNWKILAFNFFQTNQNLTILTFFWLIWSKIFRSIDFWCEKLNWTPFKKNYCNFTKSWDLISTAPNFWSQEHHYAVYWSFKTLARSWPLKPMERRGSKLRSIFSTTAWNSWSIEYDHAVYWNFGTLAKLESWPQAHMTVCLTLKTILVLRPFQRDLICPTLIAGTQVMLEKVYFSW
jgi:hypothetical protein